MKPVLEIKQFSKTYSKGKKAADSVTLTVFEGEIHAFIGHNGAGKTTTIRAVVGVLDFEEGEILIDGHSVKLELLPAKSLLSYIPDNPNLYDYITGGQYLSFISDIYRVPTKERKERIEKYAGMFGITDALSNLISSYSHGMKQKTALIGALLHEPKLPPLLVSGIYERPGAGAYAVYLVSLLLVPTAEALFMAVMGMFFNVKYP